MWTQLLAGVAPFDAMTEPERETLASRLHHARYEPGETVYGAGDPSVGMKLLVSGAVVLTDVTLTTLSSEPALRIDRPGACFSLGSLLMPFAHRHQVVAETDVELLLLPRRRFQRLIEAGDPAGHRLLDHLLVELGANVRTLNGAIHDLLAHE